MRQSLYYIFTFIFLSSCTTDPMHIQQANKIIITFSDDAYKRDRFYTFGTGGALMEDIKKINLSYVTEKKVSLPEARVLLVDNVERLLNQINTDCEARPYLHTYPFKAENLTFWISFNEILTRKYMPPPYIASVALLEGDVLYYFSDEKENIHKILKESYRESLKIATQGDIENSM